MVSFQRIGPAPADPRAGEQMVPMRDGVRLATDVYLAGARREPGPVVLIRLPYDKSGPYTAMPATATLLNDSGYHVVVQDVRGKFRSEGETVMFTHEAADGYDTIDWITRQPWSDGAVGMCGDSYYGFTQWAAASTGHPALRAISPRLTGMNLGALPTRARGSRTSEVEMGVHRLYPATIFVTNDIVEWEMEWSRRPPATAVEEVFAAVGHRSATYDAWLGHDTWLERGAGLERDAWLESSVEQPTPPGGAGPTAEAPPRFPAGHPLDAPPVPALLTIGWWDNCAPWQWQDVAAIADRPAWAAVTHLLIEAIDHENYDLADLPITADRDHADDDEALATMLHRSLGPTIAFFDRHLRGDHRGGPIPKVRFTIAGEREVRTSPSWPPSDASPVAWHLSTSGSLDSSPCPDRGGMTWRHDPDDPVPSPVGNAFAFVREWPDERGLAERNDVLVFATSPFADEAVLIGPVDLRATVISTGPEMDLFARLCDVAPDGSAHLVARGQLTVHGSTAAAVVAVPMGHVGYRVAAGHRLRLTVASSDAPEFVVAPGTGERRWLATGRCTNDQHIAIGGPDGARLTAALLPPTPEHAGRAPETRPAV